MAIAVNDTRWARATGNNGNDGQTTSQTPAADSALIAVVQTDDADGTITVSGGAASLTTQWSQALVTAAGRTYIWTALVNSSPGAFQILADDGEGGLGGVITMKVYEVTGINPNDFIGATATGTSATDNITPTVFNSTVDNSRTIGGAIDTANTATAPTSSDTEDAFVNLGGWGSMAVYKAADTATAGTGVTLNFDSSGATAAWSWAAIEILPPSPPDAPTITSQAGGHERAGVQWTAGATNGGSAVTGHKIRHATAAAPTTWLGTTDTSSTNLYGAVTGLTNGTAYVFQVLAYNAIGDGAWSATSGSATPSDVRGFLLLENGDKFLLENGDRFLLESGAGAAAVGPGFRRRPQQLLYR